MDMKNKINSKGISLIVLIITIIVIIILATAIILSLNDNNVIDEADTARYESDRANMQALLTATINEIYTQNLGKVNIQATLINTVTTGENQVSGEITYTVKSRVDAGSTNGTIVFDKGTNTATTYYTGKKLPIYAAGETKWYVDSEGVISLEVAGVKYGSGEIEEAGAEPSAAAVALDPTTYYGKTITNYETGDATIDAQVDWQIFHSDGNNIYLIATDYIAGSLAPAGKGGTALNFSDAYVWFTDVVANYAGSTDITDTTLQGLNSKYHAYLTEEGTTSGTNVNMQAVSYMLDTRETVWGKFAGVDAAYAIGGPTLELFIDSYNNKYDTKYGYNVESTRGYKVTTDTTADTVTWAYYFSGLDTSDSQYVISSTDKAYAMCLASPSTYNTDCLMHVNSIGDVNYNRYGNDYSFGVRPLVCLNSNVALEAVEGGFAIQ